MPYNFQTHKLYTIDYNSLLDELLGANAKIFDNQNIQFQYFHSWIQRLKYLDNILVQKHSDPKYEVEFMQLLSKEPETFQQPINFKNYTILVHFRVTYINQLLKSQASKPIELPIERFSGDSASIFWTPVKNLNPSFKVSKNAVIAVPFLEKKISLLVIDGNHRLTKALISGKKTVNLYSINIKSVIENYFLTSGFDLNAYIFYNEINNMSAKKLSQHCNDYEMIQSSYLHNGIYHF